MDNVNLCIVGHVDHGKSTLIGRLLYESGSLRNYEIADLRKNGEIDFAHFLDIYTEERNNAMTIDATRRSFNTLKYAYQIIDSPGHKEFIKNALNGISSADHALLIISADEGIKEQTKRHLNLLQLFDIKLTIVAINKMDFVNYDQTIFDKVVSEVQSLFSSVNIDSENVTFVPISAKLGENITKKSENMMWYAGEPIMAELDKLSSFVASKDGPLRISAQMFLRDNSTVLGRVESGTLNLNDELIFFPSASTCSARQITLGSKNAQTASKGDSVAIRLELDGVVKRGEVATHFRDPVTAVNHITVKLFVPYGTALELGEKLIFNCGSIQTECKISNIFKKIDSESLLDVTTNTNKVTSCEIGIVKLYFEEKVAVEKYADLKALGRFILTKGTASFPGIVLEKEPKTKIACTVSPNTPLKELTHNESVRLLRFNGAFDLPDFSLIKKMGLPIFVDLPNGRKKKMTTQLKDDQIIQEVISNRIDYVALSYVKHELEIQNLREKLGKASVKIISKIETKEALDRLKEIIKISDMVLIDRGDLGTDIGFENVPFYEEKIISLCKKHNKQILIATEIASSTINNNRLSCAEISQIHNFVAKGVDYIVLAEETATSVNAVQCVQQIEKILSQTHLFT
tara:strand:+ start:913 stop:2808 length:1896 start_codon:yes stop_codon:yes gene_type:complete